MDKQLMHAARSRYTNIYNYLFISEVKFTTKGNPKKKH